MQEKIVHGFSKLSKEEKVNWVVENYFTPSEEAAECVKKELSKFWIAEESLQRTFDNFSENTLSNYLLPFGVAPNFLINGKVYAIPMVIEESSVVAAASSASKFWLKRGGFKAEVISTKKLGQVHFTWKGDFEKLRNLFDVLKEVLLVEAAYLTGNMEKRGGGILDISLKDLTAFEPNYYQLFVSFETCDSMGANFINSILEQFAQTLKTFIGGHPSFDESEREVEIIMAILSNYTPECVVRASVECSAEAMEGACQEMSGPEFAKKFQKAVRIAHIDPYRATTHNKGIYNGVDAVVIATGNDFRAVEACGHTYASKDGQYRSLSSCTVEHGVFKFWIDLPIALGTVGGLTKLHPLAKRSLELLGNPGAEELMKVIAVAGLAQNFAALRSLITTGIQRGHMKMHLANILIHLKASQEATTAAISYFENNPVSVVNVRSFLENFDSQA
jgi:hydroxymethylglutaryl-CoA reductase